MLYAYYPGLKYVYPANKNIKGRDPFLRGRRHNSKNNIKEQGVTKEKL